MRKQPDAGTIENTRAENTKGSISVEIDPLF